MIIGWKLKLAPLWVPIIPATGAWLICFVSLRLTTEIATKSASANMSLSWRNAQSGVISFIPDPFFAAITVYIITMPCVYLMVGKILQDKAIKEKELESVTSSETSDLKRGS